MGNQLKQWPSCSSGCADLRELKSTAQSCSMPQPCEWRQQGACECNELSGSSQFFNDDDVLWERLEAASHGDRLLTKLHVNVALFSTTACDIVEGLLQMTRYHQNWRCGEELSLHQSLHEGLQYHARPPVSLMKTLQWVYRVEEMPSPAALPARQCVLLFFSTMLAAAAALKWQRSPPDAWKQKGLEAADILRDVESRLSEVIAALRFLACVALLQHCADPALLGSKKTMSALTDATGVKVNSAGDQSAVWKHMDGIGAPRFDLSSANLDSDPSLLLKPDPSWDSFFNEARRRPTDAAVSLLHDLHFHGKSEAACHVGTDVSGPMRLAFPMIPQAAMDMWDDELVDLRGQGVPDSQRRNSDQEDFFGDEAEYDGGVHIVVPL